MSDDLSKICSTSSIAAGFRAGNCSRPLGVAVALRPATAFAQGQCGGARAGTPECDPTPAKLPFEPTGWKTVLLDHLSCQVVGLPEGGRVLRRADELEDPQRRRQAGGARHRRLGRSRHPRRLSGAARRRRAGTAGDAAAGGRGGGRGGPRAPRNAVFDSFCWGIEPWDAKKVEAELRKRGLDARRRQPRQATSRAST